MRLTDEQAEAVGWAMDIAHARSEAQDDPRHSPEMNERLRQLNGGRRDALSALLEQHRETSEAPAISLPVGIDCDESGRYTSTLRIGETDYSYRAATPEQATAELQKRLAARSIPPWCQPAEEGR